jgi:hypothetical protein
MPFVVPTFRTDSADGRNFTLVEAVDYYTEANGLLEKVILPVGAQSDGGSMPEEVWSLPGYAPFGPMWRWFFLHDGFYRRYMLNAAGQRLNWDRATCDKVLLEGAANTAADIIHRLSIYDAVREFGQAAWDAGHAGGAA